jgi:hypothetical protein
MGLDAELRPDLNGMVPRFRDVLRDVGLFVTEPIGPTMLVFLSY